MFRITDYETTAGDDTRYIVVFRLNRDPRTRIPGTSRLPRVRGEFDVRSYDTAEDASHLGPKQRHCFMGPVKDIDKAFIRSLDRLPLSSRDITVRIRPTTPLPDGTYGLGNTLTRKPTLRAATLRLNDRATRAALGTTGC